MFLKHVDISLSVTVYYLTMALIAIIRRRISLCVQGGWNALVTSADAGHSAVVSWLLNSVKMNPAFTDEVRSNLICIEHCNIAQDAKFKLFVLKCYCFL
jgi:hypothetical protein